MLLRALFVFGFVVLGLGIALQIHNPFKVEVSDGRGVHLEQYIPTEVSGWRAVPREVGDTERLRSVVERTLRYDDVTYWQFADGERFFEVYAAYWGDGKMPTQMVASHTPDRCWTENGWRILQRQSNIVNELDGVPILPAQWRRFSINDHIQYVYFWHLVGGTPYDYGERIHSRPGVFQWVRDAIRYHLSGAAEQYFIRINSNLPFDELWEDAGFREVVAGLMRLGLADQPEAPAS